MENRKSLHIRALNRNLKRIENVKSDFKKSHHFDINFSVDSILKSVPKYKPRQCKVNKFDNSYVPSQGQECFIGKWILDGLDQNKNFDFKNISNLTAEIAASILTKKFYQQLDEAISKK